MSRNNYKEVTSAEIDAAINSMGRDAFIAALKAANGKSTITDKEWKRRDDIRFKRIAIKVLNQEAGKLSKSIRKKGMRRAASNLKKELAILLSS